MSAIGFGLIALMFLSGGLMVLAVLSDSRDPMGGGAFAAFFGFCVFAGAVFLFFALPIIAFVIGWWA